MTTEADRRAALLRRLPWPGAAAPPAAAPEVSFEFFPPRTDEAARALWQAVGRLAPLAPRFVSVTYGAGGSTRARTHATVARLLRETALEPAAHLTCVGAGRAGIDAVARGYRAMGVRHIVALRGDPPGDARRHVPVPGGYRYAAELVAGLRRVADFEISVAAYPEVHPEAASAAADLDNLRRKIDAGAQRAITQFFFEPETFLRFRDRVAAAGIAAPLVPGILPVTNLATARRFAAQCGATVPDWLPRLLDGAGDDAAGRRAAAAAAAGGLCRALCREGVTQFHFYTLNRAALVRDICRDLGLRPRAAAGPRPAASAAGRHRS